MVTVYNFQFLPITQKNMAFQQRGPSAGIPSGNLGAPGQGPTPPGDSVTSQLPVKVYSGNHKPFMAPPRHALILTHTGHPGYFASPGSYVGVHALPLKPLSRNADQATYGGTNLGGGGNTGKLKKAKKSAASVMKSAKKRKYVAYKSTEAMAAVQARTGRGSTARSSKYRKSPAAGRIPKVVSIARANRRPYIPVTLGGGSVVRLPYKR